MAIDAMDLLFTERIDVFALVTSDSDFTPLVLKLLAKGKSVIGFGDSKTPEPFKRACSLFIHTDGFGRPSDESRESSGGGEKRSRNELRGDTELSNLLRSAVEAMKGEDGAAPMARVGQYIANNSSLSPKNYGYARWSDLMRATEYFEETSGDNHALIDKAARSGRDFDELHAGRRLGYRLAVLLEAFDVKLDRAMNELHGGGPRLGDGHAAGKIGDVRAEAFGAFLNHDGVSH
jgi:hypothetical protein